MTTRSALLALLLTSGPLVAQAPPPLEQLASRLAAMTAVLMTSAAQAHMLLDTRQA